MTERTREIGTRKALGARRREILWQFLLEAVVLTAAGGVLGVLTGSAIGLGVHYATGFPVSLPWWSHAIGFGFSASVGILFGLFPAVRASRPRSDRRAPSRIGLSRLQRVDYDCRSGRCIGPPATDGQSGEVNRT